MLIPLAPSIDIIDVVTSGGNGVTILEIDVANDHEEEVVLLQENCCCECCIVDYLESETYLFERFF